MGGMVYGDVWNAFMRLFLVDFCGFMYFVGSNGAFVGLYDGTSQHKIAMTILVISQFGIYK